MKKFDKYFSFFFALKLYISIETIQYTRNLPNNACFLFNVL